MNPLWLDESEFDVTDEDREYDLEVGREGGKRFLALLLGVFGHAGATVVRFSRSPPEKCLLIRLNGSWVEVMPVPASVRSTLFDDCAAALFGRFRACMYRGARRFGVRRPRRELTVESSEGRPTWTAMLGADLIEFRRQ